MHWCRKIGRRREKCLDKVGDFIAFDSITITEVVNQNLIFSFSSSLLTVV